MIGHRPRGIHGNLLKGEHPRMAAEQQDAADEVRASTMAALAADLGVRRTSGGDGRQVMTSLAWRTARNTLVGQVVSLPLVLVCGLVLLTAVMGDPIPGAPASNVGSNVVIASLLILAAIQLAVFERMLSSTDETSWVA